jgi:regulator of protease activity HflC (stomatin/prohibitin superfamily)
MKHLSVLAILVGIALLLLVTGCAPYSTDETEVGVRTIKLAIWGKKGVEETVYPPASTYFFLPFITDWHTFDTKLQNLEMSLRNKHALIFKTVDGNDISLDVIVAYRIDPQQAYSIVRKIALNDKILKEKIVLTIARSKLRNIFAELKTEEFYVADKRATQAHKAREVLQEILGPMGILVEKIMTKDYRFNPRYQKAIEDKKIADQLVEKYKSSQQAVKEQYKRKLEEVKGDVYKMVANIDGEYLKIKVEADAYYEEQKLLAEAIKAEGIAESKSIREMNKAMAGSGGETMVKLRIAEALQNKKIVLLPVSGGGVNLRTTDINKLIDTMR